MRPGAGPKRPDYPRQPSVDYFRRGPRSDEVFFVFGRDGVNVPPPAFLADRKAAAPPVTEARGRPAAAPRLKRSLTLCDLVLYGIVLIQPMAPMSLRRGQQKSAATSSPRS